MSSSQRTDKVSVSYITLWETSCSSFLHFLGCCKSCHPLGENYEFIEVPPCIDSRIDAAKEEFRAFSRGHDLASERDREHALSRFLQIFSLFLLPLPPPP